MIELSLGNLPARDLYLSHGGKLPACPVAVQ
jgi:hypothetical protein